ncbi:MAG: hypothetical protein Q9178_007582 [Gyalolechia marmorata]
MAGYPVESEIKHNDTTPISTIAQPEGTEVYQGTVKEELRDEGEAVMEDLYFVLFGDLEGTDAGNGVDIARIYPNKNCQNADWDDSKMQIEATEHLNSSDGPSLFLGHLKQAPTVSRARILRLMNRQIGSGYYSSMDRTDDVLKFGACYNLQEDPKPKIQGKTATLNVIWQSLSFCYNLVTGHASYLLACSNEEDFEYYKGALDNRKLPVGRYLHPFSIHLFLLFKGVLAKSEAIEDTLRRLRIYESRSIYQSSKVTFETGDETKLRLQELHSLFKELVIRENNNKRYIASIESLICDLHRLQKAIKSTKGSLQIDDYDHQRMLDGFHCLKSFCLDRERRIATRSRRAENLIALTYNLLANRDNITSHEIAHEARQDGAAMKTIAFVTMLFFPATFVSSFLGTNLVNLEVGADGSTRFVFSHLWWIYLVSAIPLTFTTLLAWLFFVKRRSRKERAKWQRAGDTKV